MKKKRIGEKYDKKLFVPAFEAAAEGLIRKVMGEFADSEKGIGARVEAVNTLKEQIKEVPIEYYRTLEAFINGEDVTKYADFTRSPEELEYFRSVKKKGLIDLVAAHKDGSWVIKQPEADAKYYELRFATERTRDKRQKQNNSPDLRTSRGEAMREAREMLVRFDYEAKKIRRKRAEAYKDMRRQHAAFISEKEDISRHDPAHRLLGGLYAEFKKEYKTLSGMEDMVMRYRRKLIPLEQLCDRGVATERERASYESLRSRCDFATRDMECYMNALDELNEVRFKNGIISEQLYIRRFGVNNEISTRPTTEPDLGESIELPKTAQYRPIAAERQEISAKERDIDEPEIK